MTFEKNLIHNFCNKVLDIWPIYTFDSLCITKVGIAPGSLLSPVITNIIWNISKKNPLTT